MKTGTDNSVVSFPLTFVDSLDLDVKHKVRVDLVSSLSLDIVSKNQLVGILGFFPLLAKGAVVHELGQSTQFVCLLDPFLGPQGLGNQLAESWVAV